MHREAISTPDAPAALGPYSQGIRVGNTVYLSGQIPLDPATGQIVEGDFEAQVGQAFRNLRAVAKQAGGSLSKCVKMTLFLTDMTQFPVVNAVMERYISQPYPARSTVAVSALPRGAAFEVEAVMVLD
jgi:reactive intermediate/imine deaminase